jgi:5'-nucleotidase
VSATIFWQRVNPHKLKETRVHQARRRICWLVLILIWAAPLEARAPGSQRLTVLLSNDDGYSAPGLQALIHALEPVADVYVAAPADNQSGKGHSITIGQPIYVHDEKQPDGRIYYAIEATPATCVSLGLAALMKKKPDVVISGINRGDNLGLVIYYSGTVGAAREAVMSGLPAIAVSMQGDNPNDYAAAASYVRRLVQELRTLHLLKAEFFLNVNVPAGESKGVRVAPLSTTRGHNVYQRRTDAQGHTYYLQTWGPPGTVVPGTDIAEFIQGYITLTPLMLDETAPRKEFKALLPLERSTPPSAAAD